VPGLLVEPFPEPGTLVRTSMEKLQIASQEVPTDPEALQELGMMPRPWEPATCGQEMREELWEWLDDVAKWVNREHLWAVTRPGIPECWPAHRHIVHDLAVLACSRYYVTYAVTPGPLEDWHRYQLPAFLQRLQDRLDGQGCQPGKHEARPRAVRDDAFIAAEAIELRQDAFEGDSVIRPGVPRA